MFSLVIFSIPIAIADWKYRRIPNIYLIFITYWVGLEKFICGISSPSILCASIAVAFLAVTVLGIGMGDAKLFVLISIAVNISSPFEIVILICAIYLAASIQICITWVANQKIPRSIPMAFSLFFGGTLYLAARGAISLQEYADALVNSW